MILYSSPLSPFGARARFSLRYKGFEFDEVKPSQLGGMAGAEFLAVAPLGRIPVLELDGGERIAESDTIVEYLEDAHPERPLRPAEPLAAARARLIARISDLYLLNRLLWGGVEGGTPIGVMMPLAQYRAPAPADREQIAREAGRLAHGLDNLARLLDEEGPFALGAQPTLADGAMVPYLLFVRYAADLLDVSEITERRWLFDYLDRATAADPHLGEVRSRMEAAMRDRRELIAQKFGKAA